MLPKFAEIPYDVAAEGAVIGSMLIDSDCIPHVIEYLSQDDFYNPEAKMLYKIICDLWRFGQPVDAVMVRNKFPETEKKALFDYLVKALDAVPHSAHANYYAQLVYKKSVERKLIGIVESMGTTVTDMNMTVDEKLAAFKTSLISDLPEIKSEDKSSELSALAENCLQSLESEGGLTTGFSQLDWIINGFKKDNFILIAGRPSMGKTSLMGDFFIHCARIWARPYIYSLETPSEIITQRLIKNVSRCKVFDKNSQEIIKAVDVIRKWPAWIENKIDYKIEEICTQIIVQKQKANIGIAFVDYLQLIEGRGKSRYEQVAHISRELKKTAIRTNIPIIALSQLNRACEMRNNHRPILSDLRESGSLEQDADVILFLHRDDYYRQKEDPDAQLDGLAQMIIAKNREGQTGDINLIWLPEFTSFAQQSNDKWESKPVQETDNIPF